jgi:hypothetical protein
MDNATNKIVAHKYHYRENYESAYQMFKEIMESGLQPAAITIDGNTSVIRALKTAWPDIIIQRCRTHIQRQGLSWLRRYPKLEASKDLRKILLTLPAVKDERGGKTFIKDFCCWEDQYGRIVVSLPSKDKVYGDLQRTRSLILHALQQQRISWKVTFPGSRKHTESIVDCRKSIGKLILPGTLI